MTLCVGQPLAQPWIRNLGSVIIANSAMHMMGPRGHALDDLSQIRIMCVRFGHVDPMGQVGHQSEAVDLGHKVT